VTGVSISARSISELLKNEFQTRQRLKLERIVSKIAAQLIRSSNNFTKWINEGLKDLCEHLGASSTYIYITDDNLVEKDHYFQWRRKQSDSRPVPEYAKEPIKEEILFVRNKSSSSLLLPVKSGDRYAGCMGFDYDDCNAGIEQDNIKILRIFTEILANILERNKEERMLSRNEEKFRELFHNETDLIFVTHITEDGSPGPIIEVNDMACKMLGYAREELLSIHMSELGIHMSADNMGHIAESLHSGETVFFEMLLSTKNRDRIPVDISARIFELNHEKVVLTVARDITKQKQIEQKLIEKNRQLTKALQKLERAKEQLIYNEKLACIGQLAAGVAHEINNPLSFICSNIEITRKNYEDFKEVLFAYQDFAAKAPDLSAEGNEEEVRKLMELEKKKDVDFMLKDQDEMFNDIEDGLKRISGIIMGLRAFSRQGRDNEFEEYDLNKGIQNSLLIARNDIKYHADVKADLGEIPLIQALSSKIDQVLLNIILNASCAIRDKKMEGLGLITISTDVKHGFVRCRIEDNGVGIEKKNIGKIFDPFFTTKPPGQGTGMGLSIAYDIVVNQHGGQLLVESTPMVGSRFTILLPVDRNIEKVTGNE